MGMAAASKEHRRHRVVNQQPSSSKDESDVGVTGTGSSSIRTRQAASPVSGPTSTCNASNAGGASTSSLVVVEAAIQPLRDQQRQMTERLVKLQHTLDHFSNQQRER